MKRILFSFQQVGGANALLPLIRRIESSCEVVVTGRGVVCENLSGRGIAVTPYGELGWDGRPTDGIPEGLRKNPPEMIITDTIALDRAEDGIACRQFWRWAHMLGIPSVAYVDCWWGYHRRFRLPGESSPPVMPDLIAAIDELARKDLVSLGYPEESIVVTGSPRFEQIESLKKNKDAGAVRKLKQEMGIPGDGFNILFVSQPLVKTFGSEKFYGFTERSTFAKLVKSLNGVYPDIAKQLTITVLLHPEENETILKSVLEEIPSRPPVIFRKGNPHLSVLAADLVTGMFSMLLAEAVLLERPVLSIQPDLAREEILVTNIIGATMSVNSDDELNRILQSAVTSSSFRHELLERQKTFQTVPSPSSSWQEIIGRAAHRQAHPSAD